MLFRLIEEQQRRALKRTYEQHNSRDEYWSEPKRAATSNRFEGQQNFQNDRFVLLVLYIYGDFIQN